MLARRWAPHSRPPPTRTNSWPLGNDDLQQPSQCPAEFGLYKGSGIHLPARERLNGNDSAASRAPRAVVQLLISS